MKKILLLFIISLGFGSFAFAQERSNAPAADASDRNQKVKQEVIRILDTYRTILGQIGAKIRQALSGPARKLQPPCNL